MGGFLMGDKNYERTSGYRNWMNRRVWLPIIKNGIAWLAKDRAYDMRDDGWRRVKSDG
jgi:hypothetical protein